MTTTTQQQIEVQIVTPDQVIGGLQAALQKMRDHVNDPAWLAVIGAMENGVSDLDATIKALADKNERDQAVWLGEAMQAYNDGVAIGRLEALVEMPIAQLLSMTHQRLREHLAALGSEGKLDTDTARTLWAELTKIASHDKYLLALLSKAAQP